MKMRVPKILQKEKKIEEKEETRGSKKKDFLNLTPGTYCGITNQEIQDLMEIENALLDSIYDTRHKRVTIIVKKYILNNKKKRSKKS